MYFRPIKVVFSFWLTVPNNTITQLTYLEAGVRVYGYLFGFLQNDLSSKQIVSLNK